MLIPLSVCPLTSIGLRFEMCTARVSRIDGYSPTQDVIVIVIAIVVSRGDRASQHIGDHLLDIGDWADHVDTSRPDVDGGGSYYRQDGVELREFEQLHIHMEDPVSAFSQPEAVSAVIFVSRHSGDTGPLLTAHFTGNFGDAEYGGRPGSFAPAAPALQKRLVEQFKAHAPSEYDVGIECTHHGPTELSVPALFAELGSDEPQWDDPRGAGAVARAVLDVTSSGSDRRPDLVGADGSRRHLVGFGGGHYAPRFTRIVEKTAWAVGHIGSDWQLDTLDTPDDGTDPDDTAELDTPDNPDDSPESTEVVQEIFSASRAGVAVIEGDRPALVSTIRRLGYRVVSETWVSVVDDRPLVLVDALEDCLVSVDSGLRFGRQRPNPPTDGWESAAPAVIKDSLVIHPFPHELLSRTQGIDPARTREVVIEHTVAFDTKQAGSRAAGEAGFTSLEAYNALVAGLVDIFRERYDEVDRDSGVVIARETKFDPALAKKRGVPEGPAFGKLANGNPVEVDGDRVTPDQVSRVTEERYQVDRLDRD